MATTGSTTTGRRKDVILSSFAFSGNGPASPDLRPIGCLLAADNAVALDAVVARFAAQGLEVYERRESPLFNVAFVAGPDGICLELMEPRG